MSVNVIHYGSLVSATGGPAYSTYLTIKGIQLYGKQYGMESKIIMPPSSGKQHLLATDVPILYATHKNFNSLLRDNHAQIYHIQGIWSLMGHRIAAFSQKKEIPYIYTLRGMLYPQALKSKKWKKRLALLLYQSKDLRHAACIQATCEEEKKNYRELGFTNPVAVIPNAVELPDQIQRPNPPQDGVFRIGYLGRIHPRKHIERILYAIASSEMENVDTELLVIGNGDTAYEFFLKKEIERLGMKKVVFTGFLQGKEKIEAIRSLSVLAVPSDFENFGNIVVEALKEGVPVIASRGMPWQDLETYHCGWWIPNDVASLAATLKQASSLSGEQFVRMGENGQRLLHDKYNFQKVTEKMISLYQWVLQKGACPDFVEVIDA